MKFKKQMLGVMIALSLVTTSATVFAKQANAEVAQAKEESPMRLISGNVLEVSKENDGTTVALISDKDGNKYNIRINENTYVFNKGKIEKGRMLQVYFDTREPALLIQPPVHNAVIVKTDAVADTLLKVDYFDENLVAHDGKLKINISDNTKVLDMKGNKYTGELEGKLLAVEFGVTTESIPEQTSPISVVVIEKEQETQVEENIFYSFSGKVTEINKDGDKVTYLVENQDGVLSYFVTDKNTYMLDEIKMDDEITAYYETQIMTMIYPPRYNVDVVVKDSDERIIKVDLFDEELVSSDNMLKLNIAPTTETVTKNNEKYTGDFKNKKALVVYFASTRSIPAQTTPSKVVLLEDVKNENELVVGNKTVQVKELGGYKMVPLREVTDILGIEIQWDGETKSIVVGEYKLQVGVNNYLKGNESVKVDIAPVLDSEKTYIPVEFANILIEK